MARIGKVVFTIGVCFGTALLAGCGGGGSSEQKGAEASNTASTAPAAGAGGNTATPAATPAAAAPPPESTDTLTGATLAQFTGDATSGEQVFIQCKTCHVTEPGVNRIGPSLHAIVGRPAGQVAGYNYSPANKNSGITWSEEKLFQYLEKPQRVIPGTKMAFAGITDPQKRADVIAYLKTQSAAQ